MTDAQTGADSVVRDWILARFRKDNGANSYGGPTSWMHLAVCPDTVATEPHHGWDCGCYSEYTRDDDWNIHAKISCPHIDPLDAVDARHSFRGYEVPDLLDQLARIAQDDDKADPCRHSDGEARC